MSLDKEKSEVAICPDCETPNGAPANPAPQQELKVFTCCNCNHKWQVLEGEAVPYNDTPLVGVEEAS